MYVTGVNSGARVIPYQKWVVTVRHSGVIWYHCIVGKSVALERCDWLGGRWMSLDVWSMNMGVG